MDRSFEGRQTAPGRELKMCRNIKTLFNFEPPATEDEVHASELQFVRKLSGFNKQSQANTGRRSGGGGAAAPDLAAHQRALPRSRGRGGEGARALAAAVRLRLPPS